MTRRFWSERHLGFRKSVRTLRFLKLPSCGSCWPQHGTCADVRSELGICSFSSTVRVVVSTSRCVIVDTRYSVPADVHAGASNQQHDCMTRRFWSERHSGFRASVRTLRFLKLPPCRSCWPQYMTCADVRSELGI